MKVIQLLSFLLVVKLAYPQCKVIAPNNVDYCLTGRANLSADVIGGNCNSLVWYNHETGGNKLASGCDFLTPVLNCGEHTYWVQDTSTSIKTNFQAGYSIGTPPLVGAGPVGSWNSDDFITYFSADQPLILNSVTVQFEERVWNCDRNAIELVLNLENGNKKEFPIYVPCGNGVQTVEIPINTALEPGNHFISFNGSTELLTYYQNGADYSKNGPLDYDDGLHINGNGNGDNTYGGVFEWDVTAIEYCKRKPVKAYSSCGPSEICNNGIDDDCDGLIDCFDNDCYDSGTCEDFYYGQKEPPCMKTPDVEFQFDLVPQWESAVDVETRTTPIIGDLDGDGFPEVVTHFDAPNTVYILDGRDGSVKATINADMTSYAAGPGIADVDSDGKGEVYLVDESGYLRAYDHNGAIKPGFTPILLNSSAGGPDYAFSSHPSFADFDGDGLSEVYVGNEIFHALTGQRIAEPSNPNNDAKGAMWNQHRFSVAYDVLPDSFCGDCAGLELVCGNVVYSVDIASGQLTKASKSPAGSNDGPTAIVDWNGDGLEDIVMGGSCCGFGGAITIWDPRTEQYINNDANGAPLVMNPLDLQPGGGSVPVPSVGDFDGDGIPELAVVGSHGEYLVLESDLSLKWTTPIIDDSRITTSTSFDFEGDGKTEVVYRDENNLYVLDGATGTIRAQIPCGSATRTETPVVADVDADGEAEIICNCSDSNKGAKGKVTVFESDLNKWMPTRKIWNQVNYVPVFVNEDLTIPKQIQKKAKIPGQDLYLAQTNIISDQGNIIHQALPDLYVSIDSITSTDCIDDSSIVHVNVCNDDYNAPVYDFNISLYNENPHTRGSLIQSFSLNKSNTNQVNSRCINAQIKVPKENYNLFVIVNDDGSDPAAAPAISIDECDTSNNITNQKMIDCNLTSETLFNVCAGDSIDLHADKLINPNWHSNAPFRIVKPNKIRVASDTSVVFWAEERARIDSFKINVFKSFTVDLGPDTSICQGDSIQTNLKNPNHNYLWNDGSNNGIRSLKTPGLYILEVKDTNGCSYVDSLNVSLHQPILINLGNDTAICQGDSLEIDIQNNHYTYLWNDGTIKGVRSLFTQGVYSVEITDTNGCSVQDSIMVQVHNTPILDMGLSKAICDGDSLRLDAGKASSYSWNNGETTQTITVRKADWYFVEVTDSNGCKVTDSINVISSSKPKINFPNDTAICPEDSIILSPGIGLAKYTWSNGSTKPTITAKKEGYYAVVVEDSLGCLASDSTFIKVIKVDDLYLGPDVTICENDSITFDPGIWDKYQWSNGNNTQKVTISTNQSLYVQVWDSLNCTRYDSVNIDISPLPNVNLGKDTSICEGDSVLLSTSSVSGYNYLWNDGSTNHWLKVKEEGEYFIQVSNKNNCDISDTIAIQLHPKPYYNLAKEVAICPGDTHTYKIDEPGLTVEWMNNQISNTHKAYQEGVYNFRLTNVWGCTYNDSSRLIINPLIPINFGPDTTICFGDTLDLSVQDTTAQSVAWNTGQTTESINIYQSGEYSVRVTNQDGCWSKDSILVDVQKVLSPFSKTKYQICQGDSLILSIAKDTLPYEISWSHSNGDTLYATSAGTYDSYVSINHCKDTFSISVEVIDTPQVNVNLLNPQDFYCFEKESAILELEGEEIDNMNVYWNEIASREKTIELNEPGNYTAKVTHNGCEVDISVSLEEFCPANLYIPNAFSPNNDGLNDVFKPQHSGDFKDYELYIFNRWGELIFTSKDINKGWNGTYKGNPVQIDVYVYKISYKAEAFYQPYESKTLVGTVSVIR